MQRVVELHQADLRRVVNALAPEGRLQGNLDLVPLRTGAAVAEVDYYLEDAYTRVPGDGALLAKRLSACTFADKAHLDVRNHASFCWMEDLRLRFLHLFKAEPRHMLIRVEGVLSYEDVISASRTPLWGSIALYRQPRRLDAAYEKQCARQADLCLKRVSIDLRAIAHRTARVPMCLPPLPRPTSARGRSNRKETKP